MLGKEHTKETKIADSVTESIHEQQRRRKVLNIWGTKVQNTAGGKGGQTFRWL